MELEKKIFALDAVDEVSQSLISSFDLKDIAHTLLLMVTGYLAAESGMFYCFESAASERLLLTSHIGMAPLAGFATFDNTPELSQWFLSHSYITRSECPPSLAQFFDALSLKIGFPVVASNEVLGICFFGEKATGLPYQQTALELAALLVHQASSPIRNSHFYSQLKENNRLLEQKVEERTAELQTINHELLSVQRRMSDELKAAALLQKSMTPDTPPYIKKVALSHYFQLATESGGDWFNYYVYQDYLFILIGDVTGHGMSAAMVVSAVNTTWMQMQNLVTASPANLQLTPAFILDQFNYSVNKIGNREYLMTCFVARLHLISGELIFANAGHNLPLLYRHDQTFSVLFCQGNHLGYHLKTRYNEKTEYLKKGDLILFYTDGLIENTNCHGEEFGMHRLRQLIYNHGETEPDSLNQILQKEAFDFYQDESLKDDLTYILLGVRQEFTGKTLDQ